jgi:glycosyltransferase involved in cell wall biosynthesis
MNIIYDFQAFSFQEFGGISNYYYQLVKNISEKQGNRAEIIIKYSNNYYLDELGYSKTVKFFPEKRFKGRNEIIKRLNQLYFQKKIKLNRNIDLFHPTYYDPYFLKLIPNIPFILTIHDMTHELFPESFSNFDYTIKNKRILAQKAGRIIAISESTKKDIISILKIPENKIDVIYHASSISKLHQMIPSVNLPERYLLFVGKRNTYKNFNFFLEAVCGIKEKINIVCAGGGSFNFSELKLLRDLRLSDRTIQLNVTNAELSYLYSNAVAFVFPSLYEGFGMPVLEAFSCGCPAILSEKSSLPEIAGEAALFFNPQKIESLRKVLEEILVDQKLAESLIALGYQRVKLFSWEKTVQKTIEVYSKVLKL